MKATIDFMGNHSTILDGINLSGGINNDRGPAKQVEATSLEELTDLFQNEFNKRMEYMKQNYKKYKLFPRDFRFDVSIDPKSNPNDYPEK